MKGIKTVWTCGPGSKSDIRVRLNWIPSGDSTGRKLVRLSWSLVVRLATTSNNSRVWQFCGEKSTRMFSRNIGLLLRWLNRLKILSYLDPARVSIIGIKPSARFMVRQLRSMLMRSVKWLPRLKRRSKIRQTASSWVVIIRREWLVIRRRCVLLGWVTTRTWRSHKNIFPSSFGRWWLLNPGLLCVLVKRLILDL